MRRGIADGMEQMAEISLAFAAVLAQRKDLLELVQQQHQGYGVALVEQVNDAPETLLILFQP